MPSFKEYSDIELLSLLKEGNETAFVAIYERYWDALCRHARRMLHDDDEVYDVLHDVFALLWHKGADLYITTSLSGYLFTLVRNRILNKISRNKIHDHYIASLADFSNQGRADADFELREKQLAELIDQQISVLPTKMRQVFILSRKHHLSYKEIASKLNVSEHTVKKQINNALNLLRVRFKEFLIFTIIFLDGGG